MHVVARAYHTNTLHGCFAPAAAAAAAVAAALLQDWKAVWGLWDLRALLAQRVRA
jgi:hypothetical protein